MVSRHPYEPFDYIHATTFIDKNHADIQKLAKELTEGLTSPRKIAMALFRYVRDEIRFEFLPKTEEADYKASNVLKAGAGFCVQKAILLAALGRAAGIPTALVLSDLADHSLSPRVVEALGTNVLRWHGLVSFFIEGDWRKADPTFSPDVVMRKGYWPVDFDGSGDALLAETTISGEPHAEYLAWHGFYGEAPVGEMIVTFQQFPAGAFAAINDEDATIITSRAS